MAGRGHFDGRRLDVIMFQLQHLSSARIRLVEDLTLAKDNLRAKIDGMLSRSVAHRTIARRLFLYDFCQVFANDQERGFVILEAVRSWLNIDFSEIRIVGSAQLGFSCYKKRDFTPGQSDLDIAIISPSLFRQFSEEVYWLTKRYSDLTKFGFTRGVSNVEQFRNALSIGFFRPDLMPDCARKDRWREFFERLSEKHSDLFKNINGGIYLSEGFFEIKNAAVVEDIRKA